ncbi:hypothetical protein PVAND_003203 [Polypedilum vanderplanki]|uniref:Chromo domain-containing protein n=1 Tax=Polypedilum vanderplanki TaxID=319348 RepID=A0A9J6BTS1_POLVA|nr:hypothetical protein PVAND_003203 [Polypedilum vanderplanki]
MGKSKEKQTQEEYFVEKILQKRVIDGSVEYYLKWEGYSNADNTWEKEENLNCPEKVAEFEERIRQKEPASKKRKRDDSLTAASPNTSKKKTKGTDGFDRGLDPEKIIGATEREKKLMFLMKWKNTDEADLVYAEEANVICPQIVIKFYEERLSWKTNN